MSILSVWSLLVTTAHLLVLEAADNQCPRSGCGLCADARIRRGCPGFCRFCERRTLELALRKSLTMNDLRHLPDDSRGCPTRNCKLCKIAPQLSVRCPKFCRSCQIRLSTTTTAATVS